MLCGALKLEDMEYEQNDGHTYTKINEQCVQ